MRTAHPAVLATGDKVAVTCPASPVDPERLARGTDRLRELGLTVVTGDSCEVRNGMFAGSDLDRARELLGFLLDPTIDAVFAGRGGVGCLQLLPYLEEIPPDAAPRWVIGRSDLTALHLALWGRLGWVGLSGPMVATDLAGDAPGPVIERMRRLLFDPAPAGRLGEPALQVWREGEAEGPLIPANLSLLASMAGTGFLPPLQGAILVLEEIEEPPQRIDRMLTQLRLSGALDGIGGLVYGQFTACAPRESSLSPDILEQVLQDHGERIGVPVIAGFPYGHESLFQPLPVGVRARITTDPPGLILIEGVGSPAEGSEA